MLKRSIFIVIIFTAIALVQFFMVQNKSVMPKQQPHPKPKIVQRTSDIKIKSSIPYWDQENAFVSFRNNARLHDYLNLFWYYLTDDNNIATYEYATEDQNIITLAHQNNVHVFATITNLPETGGWDSSRVEDMMSTKSSRKKHINDIITKLDELNFDGVNIDYEEVDADAKNNFTLFISELATSLHQNNKLLSISLHPKRAGSVGLGEFQDWKKLAKASDQLTIMAFNEHYDESDAGPIASIPWLEKIMSYAVDQSVPRDKIYLGIPFFAYDWNHDNDEAAVGLTYSGVQGILNAHDATKKWDDKSGAPFFTYENDGEDHEVWYEDARSVKEKVDFAKRQGLAGVSFWRLGGEDPQIWREL